MPQRGIFVDIHIQHLLKFFKLHFFEVTLIAYASVEHDQTEVQILGLAHDFVVKVHLGILAEISDHDPRLNIEILQVIRYHTLKFALSARNQADVEALLSELLGKLESDAVSRARHQCPGTLASIPPQKV